MSLKPQLQQKPAGGMVLRTLSESEQNARQAAEPELFATYVPRRDYGWEW